MGVVSRPATVAAVLAVGLSLACGGGPHTPYGMSWASVDGAGDGFELRVMFKTVMDEKSRADGKVTVELIQPDGEGSYRSLGCSAEQEVSSSDGAFVTISGTLTGCAKPDPTLPLPELRAVLFDVEGNEVKALNTGAPPNLGGDGRNEYGRERDEREAAERARQSADVEQAAAALETYLQSLVRAEAAVPEGASTGAPLCSAVDAQDHAPGRIVHETVLRWAAELAQSDGKAWPKHASELTRFLTDRGLPRSFDGRRDGGDPVAAATELAADGPWIRVVRLTGEQWPRGTVFAEHSNERGVYEAGRLDGVLFVVDRQQGTVVCESAFWATNSPEITYSDRVGMDQVLYGDLRANTLATIERITPVGR